MSQYERAEAIINATNAICSQFSDVYWTDAAKYAEAAVDAIWEDVMKQAIIVRVDQSVGIGDTLMIRRTEPTQMGSTAGRIVSIARAPLFNQFGPNQFGPSE